MAKVEVKVPDIGDFKDVPVIEVLVKAGDTVKAEQSLITLESDKATMEVPSPVAGAVAKESWSKVGDKVSKGTLIARVESGEGEGAKAAAAPAKAPAPLRRRRQRPHRQKPAAAARWHRHRRRAAKAAADRDQGSGHRRLQGRPGHRDPGQGRRHGRGGAVDRDARIRQGDDGRAVAGGRQDHGIVGQGRRQGVDGLVDREARRGRSRLRRSPLTRRTRRTRRKKRTPPRRPTPRPSRQAICRRGRRRRATARRCLISPAFSPAPAVRRLARELGLDLNQIKGTGEKGRITREDVKAALSQGGGGLARGRRRRAARGAAGRLRQIRSDRNRPALAHQEDLRAAAPCLLGQHSARHALRRSGHHRSRRLPKSSRRRREERKVKALPRLVAAASHAGRGRRTEGFPDFQRRSQSAAATL